MRDQAAARSALNGIAGLTEENRRVLDRTKIAAHTSRTLLTKIAQCAGNYFPAS
jgi:hypothetical protein